MLKEKAEQELSLKDSQFLSELIGRGVERLTPAEKAHVVARSCYLSKETLEKMDIDGMAKEIGGSTEVISPYDTMTVPELKKLCKERELDMTELTKKAEFIAVLEGDDKDVSEDGETIIVTQEFLDENPAIAEQGVKVGDEVEVGEEK